MKKKICIVLSGLICMALAGAAGSMNVFCRYQTVQTVSGSADARPVYFDAQVCSDSENKAWTVTVSAFDDSGSTDPDITLAGKAEILKDGETVQEQAFILDEQNRSLDLCFLQTESGAFQIKVTLSSPYIFEKTFESSGPADDASLSEEENLQEQILAADLLQEEAVCGTLSDCSESMDPAESVTDENAHEQGA